MQTKTLLITAILVSCFFMLPVYSQSKDTKEIDFFSGTWGGMVVRATSTGEVLSTSLETWRIHNVDRNKSQVEMTEWSFRINGTDTATIKRPRMKYPVTIGDKFLIIPIKDIESDTTFMLKVLLEEQKGQYALVGEAGNLTPKKEKLIYGLAKMDSDTTNKHKGFVLTPPVAPKK